MAKILTILTDPAPALLSTALPVVEFDDALRQLLDNMHLTLQDFRLRQQFGRAMAAPQVGIGLRIIVLQLGGQPFSMINPSIVWRSDERQTVWDDCLSVPDLVVQVERHASISVAWQDENGRPRRWEKLPPEMAELIQHEYDHLDGILMTARALGDDAIRPIRERAQLIGAQRRPQRLSLDNILLAAQTIDPLFLHSPQYVCPALSEELGCRLMLKLETANPLRCFKGRGADFVLARAAQRGETRPIVCASAGNWGLALAWGGAKYQRPVTVFAPRNASRVKLTAIERYGADIRLAGQDFDSAKREAKNFAARTDSWFIEDGRQTEVSEGAGSIAVELLRAAHYDAIFVPLGNGALISGIARWVKASSPDTRLIGVCPRGADAMEKSWRMGRVVINDSVRTCADGLAVRVPVPEALSDMRDGVDEIVLVEDEDIRRAMDDAARCAGVLLEPAGAAALAGIRAGGYLIDARMSVACILTGANLSR
ncbi:pyridoxal-phosphate dependent enzyme [Affinibrenneria salicis]|uniref:Peptide deformylase n=1 Tax=Affinibrenneria salicis TaxID=2590031 RepID=A0A5J5FU23_9GAMM|nr:pyridoxal-phosphate dependent enzyme [Affinibrenneria salicis]KAA8996673.1 pyridoxal-phosphate dependent enzyme [Affinibrenneria salicis]